MNLALQPPAANYVASLFVIPQFIVGGSAASGRVTLASASTTNGGSPVTLTSDDASLTVPPFVTVKKNQTSETFTITTSIVTAPKSIVITASFGEVVQRLTAIVAPENTVTIASFAISPQRAIGGNAVAGTVTLSAPAPFGGATVTLTPSRRNMVSVPQSVTITEGVTSATFAIGTDPVHGNKDRAVDIDASYNGVTRTATLTLAPPGAAMNVAPAVKCASMALAPCYYFNDHLGTPILQTNALGDVVWRVEREPFGKVVSTRAGADRHQPLSFPGQEDDESSELGYNIFRWYRSGWGRYTQSDPAEEAWARFPDHYFYVSSNPLRWVDRIGLFTTDPSCAGLGVAGAISDMCARATKPGTKCNNALRNISAAKGDPNANSIPNCISAACNGNPPIHVSCNSCNGCGEINIDRYTTGKAIGMPNPPPVALTVYPPPASTCPIGQGLGPGPTLLHETLHICGFTGVEPEQSGPEAAWFRYAERACYGWRTPLAPKNGPPR